MRFIAILALVVLCGFSHSEDADFKPGERYSYNNSGFSIVPPDYMKFFDLGGAYKVGMEDIKKKYPRKLQVLKLKGKGQSQEYLKFITDPKHGVESAGQKISEAPFATTSGLKGIRYESKHVSPADGAYRKLQFIVEGPESMYHLIYYSSEEQAEQSNAVFDTSAKTFRLEQPK